jgi:NADPH-dependent curcumin reductase CurA
MSRGMPSLTALLGLLAIAQNRAEMLKGAGAAAGGAGPSRIG